MCEEREKTIRIAAVGSDQTRDLRCVFAAATTYLFYFSSGLNFGERFLRALRERSAQKSVLDFALVCCNFSTFFSG